MLRNIAPKADAVRVSRARAHRREMSLPEVLLWRHLSNRPLGLKFRRQHPSGAYVLDFFCSDARLAVEVDGQAHDMGNRPARDEARDAYFAQNGIATIRITAPDVLRDPAAMAERIVAAARNRLPLHHPAAPDGPPPRDKLGEE